jgi:hypothetical protein
MSEIEIIIDEEFGTKVEKTRNDRMKWTRRFFVDGVPAGAIDAEIQAYTLLRSFIASKYPVTTTQWIQSLNVTEVEEGYGTWRGECTFMSPTEKQILEQMGLPEYSFSTKGGTAHITHSRKTIKVYPGWRPEYYFEEKDGIKKLKIKLDENNKPVITKETAVPDFKGGIGWNEESATFDGVDVIVPNWTSTVKISIPNEYIDPLYFKMLRMLTGAVNSTPFDGMDAGECRFVGCDGSRRVVEKKKNENETENETETDEPQYDLVWDLTFEFEAAPNIRKWIDGIGYVTKRGWDYMHILRRMVDYPADTVMIEGEPQDIDPDLSVVNPTMPTEPEPTPNPDEDEEKEKEEKKKRKTYSTPVAAYIERVSPYADFKVFGLS